MSAARGSLRLLTWNVADLRGDREAVERVLRAARADVVCLQEAPRGPRAAPRLAALARRSGLLLAAGGRPGAGTAVLVSARTRVSAAAARRLPTPVLRSGGRVPRPVRPRGWAEAGVSIVGSGPLHVVSIHLGLDAGERVRHARALLAALPRDRPAVVAGDLNEPPGGPAWQVLAARLDDAGAGAGPTFPAHRPRHRIDVVLSTPGLVTTGHGSPAQVVTADVLAASDHLPVAADLHLLPG